MPLRERRGRANRLAVSLARRFAFHVKSKYGSDPWEVSVGLGLRVSRDRLSGPCREIYFSLSTGEAGIIVAADARAQEAGELLAHGIAHHLLHTGHRLEGCRRQPIWTGRHEREADDFAAYLLVPESRLVARLSWIDTPALSEVASEFGVSDELMRRRLFLLGRD
jgi:hypothetical protein